MTTVSSRIYTILAIASGFAFAFYVLTMPDTITLVDAGVLQMVCHANGVAHPPGFPVATFLCHGFSQLPFTGVTSANLFSATFSALSVGLLLLLCLRLGMTHVAATTTALALAVSAVFWQNSIVVEVYALTTFLLLVSLHLAKSLNEATSAPMARRQLYLLSLVTGLSLANHWPLVVLSGPALLAMMHPSRLRYLAHPATLFSCSALLLLGLSPYLRLLFVDSGMLFHGPITEVDDWLRYVARQSYDSTFVTQVGDAGAYLWWLPLQSLTAFGWAGVLIPLGAYLSHKKLPPHIAIAIALLWLGSCTLLPILGNLTDTYFWRHIIVNWTFLAHISSAIWLGIAMEYVVDELQKRQSVEPAWPRYAVAVITVIAIAGHTLTSRHQPQDHVADHYARTVLMLLPENATLLLRGDNQTGPIGYMHHVEGVRPDVTLRSMDNILFDNRLLSPFAPTAQQNAAILSLISSSKTPVFSITPLDLPAIDHGLFFEYNQGNGIKISPTANQFFDYVLDLHESGLIKSPATIDLMETLLYDYARMTIGQGILGSHHDADFTSRLQRASNTLQGKIWTLHHLAASAPPTSKPALAGMVLAGTRQIQEPTPNAAIAKFYTHAAEVAVIAPPDFELARRYLAIASTYGVDPCTMLRQPVLRAEACLPQQDQ